jgi:NAD(P)-dependent dehydrogenase (short-subunit alcohol dehydrogenase family)
MPDKHGMPDKRGAAGKELGVRVRTLLFDATGHVTTLLAAAGRMRAQGHGTIAVLSSAAAIRPRKANFVYGAAKSGLDAFGRGLAGSLHGTGVDVLLVRPGSVIGRTTAGMAPAAPLTQGSPGCVCAGTNARWCWARAWPAPGGHCSRSPGRSGPDRQRRGGIRRRWSAAMHRPLPSSICDQH